MSKLLQIDSPSPARPDAPRGMALLRLGFRPFYLLGALFAALGVPLWVAFHAGALAPPGGIAPTVWHAHEMVFGFAVAIVTGFLFTAVRNWTNLPTPTGARLAGLCVLWLAARIAYLSGASGIGLLVETAFLGLVGAALLAVLIRARNKRNYFVGLLFVVLIAADWTFWAAAQGLIKGVDGGTAVRFALYLIVMLTFVIAGRVVPMFTLSMVRGLRQFKDVRLDRAAIAIGAGAFVLDLTGANGVALAVVALLAAVLHGWRLAGWRPDATFGQPMLWILHAAYAWIPVGFLLMSAGALGFVPRSLAVHAFSTGVVGGLVIGMITRTALGHTGRMLVAGRSEVAMYALVQAAAVIRVLGPLLLPAQYPVPLVLSAGCWSAAFLLYVAVYGPRLSRPRVDGRDG